MAGAAPPDGRYGKRGARARDSRRGRWRQGRGCKAGRRQSRYVTVAGGTMGDGEGLWRLPRRRGVGRSWRSWTALGLGVWRAARQATMNRSEVWRPHERQRRGRKRKPQEESPVKDPGPGCPPWFWNMSAASKVVGLSKGRGGTARSCGRGGPGRKARGESVTSAVISPRVRPCVGRSFGHTSARNLRG
jgi:hypothetical protein